VQHVKDYAIFLLDPHGHVVTWNEGAQRIKGYQAHEIIGQHFSRFYPPEAVQRGRPAFGLGVATREGRWEEEGWRVRKDGTRFWADVVITALHDDDGTLVGFAKITRDLTERKRAEEDRLRLLERERQARAEAAAAETLVRTQDEFLAVAAHELKTPMTGAKIAVQMLLRRFSQSGTADAEHMQRALRTIDQQINRLSRLVGELLETARLQSDRLDLERSPTDVAALVRTAVEQAPARMSRHELSLSVPAELCAEVDATRLEQVVANLLDNALKFSPQGGRIEVALQRTTAEHLQMTVRDHGIGVPEEHRAHLFERFYQAHASTHRSGLGLGLYISQKIVARHGGTIRAEFPADGGTCMVVTVPLRSPTASTLTIDGQVAVLGPRSQRQEQR
jgi:PAS domain S-box-containing protein